MCSIKGEVLLTFCSVNGTHQTVINETFSCDDRLWQWRMLCFCGSGIIPLLLFEFMDMKKKSNEYIKY